MANVNPIEGITYGFRLIGYFIAVLAAGGIVTLIGFVFINGESPIVGGVMLLIGVLVLSAGQAGVLYKVIADGVEKGVSSASD